MESTNENLKRLRAAGWSQLAIAKQTGIPQSRLSRWEAGAVPAGADDALRIAALVRDLNLPMPKEPTHV